MLIDDRQIHSVSALKVIGLARVGLSNSYNDLDNIPLVFPPAEHTHDLASDTKNGFMSSEEYTKLKNIKEFKYINIKSGSTANTITAKTENDTLTLEAGKNIVFKYDNTTKTLYLTVDYGVEEANLKGPKGDKGDKGEQGDIWKPVVDINGNLSFSVSKSLVPPETMNIRGKQGDTGDSGKDALTPVWDNLEGKPSGNIGDVLFVKEDSSAEFEAGPIFIEGMFPSTEAELNKYKTQKYNYQFIRDNWIKGYNISDNNTSLTPEQIARYWSIDANGISFVRKDSGHAFLMDYKNYSDYEIELKFENIVLTGATSVIIASRKIDDHLSTLSFVRIANRYSCNLYPYENIFYNYAIVIDLGDGGQIVIDKMQISETIPTEKIKFKIKVVREKNIINIYWTEYVNQSSDYPDYETKHFTVDLTSVTPLHKFCGSGNVGIGCINQILKNIIFNTQSDKSNSIYPVYKDTATNLYKSYKCSPDDGLWKSSDDNIFNDIGIGRYVKDINSNKLYYIDRNEVVYIRETTFGDKMAYINYAMDTAITKELED